MTLVHEAHHLKAILNISGSSVLADTGFLYGLSDVDDRVNERALEIFELTEEAGEPIFVNVVSRMEFTDLVFRRLLTLGAIRLFDSLTHTTENHQLFNFLKSIRDENTANRRARSSYKLSEAKLKKLRHLLEDVSPSSWQTFCHEYVGDKFLNEWKILEEEFQLQFIECLEDKTSALIERPLRWIDMVTLMSRTGLRTQDAMIVNMFECSRIPTLITTDSDIIFSLASLPTRFKGKLIFHL